MMVSSILSLPRYAKRLIALLLDVSFCILSIWLAYFLRLDEFIALSGNAFLPTLASIIIALPIFIFFGLYRSIFRYTGWPALLTVAQAVSVYALVFTSIFTAIGIEGVPRAVGIIQPILLLIFVGVSRVLARVWLGNRYSNLIKRIPRSKVFIYGAGVMGRQLAAALINSHEMQVLGFLDDDKQLQGHTINGKPVYDPRDLPDLVINLGINDVLLAMPRLSRHRRNEILNQICSSPVAVRTLPSLTDLVQGRVSISDLRDLDIDDLLGREPVTPNHFLLSKNIVDKVVLVTGAGGSIGSELCRQIMAIKPTKLLLVEQSEFALYEINQALQEKSKSEKTVVVPLLASVQDYDRISEIISTWQPDTVYHAAAYKHVPLVEHNPAAGLKNNVLGTFYTAKAALENGVIDFVLISTDKAVRPTNVMGASKRLAEMVLQALAETSSDIRFSIVRFGNVLDSSGSVVPRFRKQIHEGGPVTVTDPEITRFFMTIPEAAQLVIQAGSMAKGGDVFVLDMGQPVKIVDLAKRMIELSGLSLKNEENPNGDIEIQFTGLRPGEKLYEELLIGENPETTDHPRIMKAKESFLPWSELEEQLNSLEIATDLNDVKVIRLLIQQLVSGYSPKNDIVDWVYLEKDLVSTKG